MEGTAQEEKQLQLKGQERLCVKYGHPSLLTVELLCNMNGMVEFTCCNTYEFERFTISGLERNGRE